MPLARLHLSEEEIRAVVSRIAVICLSEEFQRLKQELEEIYRSSNVDNAPLVALSDALYAFLAEEEDDYG